MSSVSVLIKGLAYTVELIPLLVSITNFEYIGIVIDNKIIRINRIEFTEVLNDLAMFRIDTNITNPNYKTLYVVAK